MASFGSACPGQGGSSLAMEAALEEADMGPGHIDYINAHEMLAIKKVLGQRAYDRPETGANLKTVMSNSFAFGGTNAALIVRKHE